MTDWSQIVEQHGPIVWRSIYRLVRHQADAEDCFQSTFVSAMSYANNHEVLNWPGLLKQIATKRALECLRRRIRRRAEVPELEHPDGDPAQSPESVAVANELAARLREALSHLDPQQAEVFCLARLEGMSYADIAARLNISSSHVGVLLHRARNELLNHLKPLLT